MPPLDTEPTLDKALNALGNPTISNIGELASLDITGNTLVSVIIPAYNAASTLSETVESVLTQTYQNLEVIIVNDCSSDETATVASRFVSMDNRVRLINKDTNEDSTLARATGFAASTGEDITFIDADDVFTKDAIETLVQVKQTTGADIAMAGEVKTDGNLIPITPRWPAGPLDDAITIYSHDEMLEQQLSGFLTWPHNNNPDHAVAKLFSREILENLDWQTTDYRLSEDTFFSLLTFVRANEAAVINKVIYGYRAVDTSKAQATNWRFTFQKQPITAMTMIANFIEKATALLPGVEESEIGATAVRLAMYYRDVKGMEVPKAILAYWEDKNRSFVAEINKLNETIEHQERRIIELEQQNQELLSSRTWKAGRVLLAPVKITRMFRRLLAR